MGFYGQKFLEVFKPRTKEVIIVLKENDTKANILLELTEDKFNVLEQVLSEMSNSEADYSKKFILTNGKQKSTVFVRNKKKGGGRSGNVSNHGPSIKVINRGTNPSEVEIKILSNKNTVINPSARGKDIDIAKKFGKDNAEDIRTIYLSDDLDAINDGYINLVNNNIDIIENIITADEELEKYFNNRKKEYLDEKRKR